MTIRLGVTVVLSVLAITGCGGAATGSDGGGATDASVGCNSTAIPTTPVTDTMGAGAEPAPLGGPIVDGTYFLSAHEHYAPGTADGMTYRAVLLVTGTTATIAQIRNAGAEERFNLAVTTTLTAFHAVSTCPVAGTALDFDAYTATPTTLALFNSSNHTVVTFTLH